MSHIIFPSRAIAVTELESIGYKVEHIGPNDSQLSAVLPTHISEDYPRIANSKAILPVASLFDTGSLSLVNGYEPLIAQHHEKLILRLKPKYSDLASIAYQSKRQESTVSFHLANSLN